jgi:hypothetical protein
MGVNIQPFDSDLPRVVKVPGDTDIKLWGLAEIDVGLGRLEMNGSFYVVDRLDDKVVLGRDFIEAYNLTISQGSRVAIFTKGKVTRAMQCYPRSSFLGMAFLYDQTQVAPGSAVKLPIWTDDEITEGELFQLLPIVGFGDTIGIMTNVIRFGHDQMEATIFNYISQPFILSVDRPLCAMVKIPTLTPPEASGTSPTIEIHHHHSESRISVRTTDRFTNQDTNEDVYEDVCVKREVSRTPPNDL